MTNPLLNPTAPAADSKSMAWFSRPILIQLLSILILLREAGGF
ncbi:MAG TPA: hypothetical protein VFD71_20480 [Planctomycetota bacterium]|jgi:hypothetical protein|nr:hypothetical protein [Planctomycetota bacterium]